MKKQATIKSGLLCGFVIGLAMHWFIFIVLYPVAYKFQVSGLLETLVSVIAALAFVLAVLGIGYLPVRWSGTEITTWKQGGIVGGGSGLIVGVIGYLINGVLLSVIILGIVPITPYLFEPARLDGINLGTMLYSVVQSAVPVIYLSILAYAVLWGIIGSIGGIAVFVIQSSIKKKREHGYTAVV